MSEIKLLPCPFCGGEAELNRTIFKGREMYSVSCKHKFDCTIGTTFLRESKEEAIKLWNTRKPMERIIERLGELEKFHARRTGSQRHLDHAHAFLQAIEIVKEEGGIE